MNDGIWLDSIIGAIIAIAIAGSAVLCLLFVVILLCCLKKKDSEGTVLQKGKSLSSGKGEHSKEISSCSSYGFLR